MPERPASTARRSMAPRSRDRRASTMTKRPPRWMRPCASTTRGRRSGWTSARSGWRARSRRCASIATCLALLLVWEIGKPWRLACADVDRALDGVDWYIAEADRQLAGRRPLAGPVSNIASWNYPMSVQVHAELVQVLAGNAVIAKTPSQGGFHCLTLAHALMAREGLPVTLVSGHGASLGDVLIRGDGIGCLAFVGGRANGRKAATTLADTGRRHFLEQEGLNAWGIWGFTQWDLLGAHIKKGFEYGKQRCTAYPRYVVQRAMFAEFLQMYLPVVGEPEVRASAGRRASRRPVPGARLRPVISADKAFDLLSAFDQGVRSGGIPLVHRQVHEGRFLDGQDTSAYVAPGLHPAAADVVGPAPQGAVRPAGLDRRRRLRVGVHRGDERVQRVPRRVRRDRRHLARAPSRRGAAGLQGRHQRAALARRPRRDLRRQGRVVEGRVRRRRPARAGGDRAGRRHDRDPIRDLPRRHLPAGIRRIGHRRVTSDSRFVLRTMREPTCPSSNLVRVASSANPRPLQGTGLEDFPASKAPGLNGSKGGVK